MAEPSRKLSSEEVNALMEGLKSGDLSASTTIKDGKEVEYKSFQFHRCQYSYSRLPEWLNILLDLLEFLICANYGKN